MYMDKQIIEGDQEVLAHVQSSRVTVVVQLSEGG